MKRLILLLMVLLRLGWCAAEEAAEDLTGFAARVAPEYTLVDGCVDGQTAMPLLSARYPDASILASACDEDDAFFVLEMGGDQPMKLCGFTLLDGSWVMTMDSDTAIRPNGLSDDDTRWNYDALALTLREDVLSICYDGWYSWQYDFAKDDEGAWRFVRLYIAYDVNATCQEVTFSGGCVSQTLTNVSQDGEQETSFSPPCPMPWLANCETLSGFDAAAFPMTVSGMPQEEQGRAAEQLLPGYTFVGGKLDLGGATYLMTNPAGELVFVGGVYEDGQWVWTESNPLPADTRCDTYHGGGDWLAISYDHPDGEPDAYGNSPYVEYVIYLQEDGRWLVETILDYEEDFFHFVADGLYINLTGLVYGQSSLERDVKKINWAEYPISIAEVLPTMSDDWGVVGEPTLPLYADAEGAALLREYCVATPVHVLEYVGDLARVQIADSDVVGYLPADGLLLGGDQLWVETEEDEEGVWSWYVTAEWEANFVVLPEGANVYAAPEGEVLWTCDWDTWLVLMADCGNGWAHVREGDSLESGYVRLADCLSVELRPR